MKAIETLSPDQARASELLRALGNPARIAILAELVRRNACVTGDLVNVLPLAQSTVSQHLKVLKKAGVVQGTLEGDVCYCVDPEPLRWLSSYLSNLATGPCDPMPSTDAQPPVHDAAACC